MQVPGVQVGRPQYKLLVIALRDPIDAMVGYAVVKKCAGMVK